MNTVHLHGCRAQPLLSYLAGLGVIRLVAEQLFGEVSARWDGDHLVIVGSELDEAEACRVLFGGLSTHTANCTVEWPRGVPRRQGATF